MWTLYRYLCANQKSYTLQEKRNNEINKGLGIGLIYTNNTI